MSGPPAKDAAEPADRPPAFRTAVVTGSAMGIGAAVAARLKYARHGYHVIGVDVADGGSMSNVNEFHKADLAEADDVKRVCATILAAHPSIDVLVNNAGVHWPPLALPDDTVEHFDNTIAVNLRAQWLMTKCLLPALEKAKGAVVNMSSVHALAGESNAAVYDASKGGVTAMTRALAVELGRKHGGIRVNAVLPGAVATPLMRRHMALVKGYPTESGATLTAEQQQSIESLMHELMAPAAVLGRIGQPEDVAEAVAFLADSNTAGFITGQCLTVDGGLLAQLPCNSAAGALAAQGKGVQ